MSDLGCAPLTRFRTRSDRGPRCWPHGGLLLQILWFWLSDLRPDFLGRARAWWGRSARTKPLWTIFVYRCSLSKRLTIKAYNEFFFLALRARECLTRLDFLSRFSFSRSRFALTLFFEWVSSLNLLCGQAFNMSSISKFSKRAGIKWEGAPR
jgi:hypothetical protein